jgi:hypothetical protein
MSLKPLRLLRQLLAMSPSERPTTRACLASPYFSDAERLMAQYGHQMAPTINVGRVSSAVSRQSNLTSQVTSLPQISGGGGAGGGGVILQNINTVMPNIGSLYMGTSRNNVLAAAPVLTRGESGRHSNNTSTNNNNNSQQQQQHIAPPPRSNNIPPRHTNNNNNHNNNQLPAMTSGGGTMRTPRR